ncbi:MAG: T9SS type A sorting domain-containing protein, partial [Prolixibacteraceae bacterium]|nr:T9SS type A sorting domain-containing protein [Prolixibacteraceae bacterium]
PNGEYIVSAVLPGFTPSNSLVLKIDDGKASYENINFTVYLGNNVITDKPEIKQFALDLYPNPTSGIINLRSSQAEQTMYLRVIDMNGKLAMRKQFEPADLYQFDIGGLRPATYIIEVRHGNKVKTFTVLLMNNR